MFDKLVNRLTQTTADEREAQKKAREAEVAGACASVCAPDAAPRLIAVAPLVPTAARQARLDDYLDKVSELAD